MMTRDTSSASAFRRLLTPAVLVPTALLSVLAVIFLSQILYLISTAQGVDHSNQVIAKANALLTLLVDGETGMRGYLVTGEPVFLAPYHAEESSSGPAFEILSALVSDQPDQGERLRTLRAAHREWRKYARTMIDLRKDGGEYATRAGNLEGKRRMDAIRMRVADLVTDAEEQRDHRTRMAQSASWIVIGISVPLTFLLGAFLAPFTRRQLFAVSTRYQSALHDAEVQANALRKSASRFEALHEIDLAIVEAHSVPDLIRSALERMERVVTGDEAFVVLFDLDGTPGHVIFSSNGTKPLAAAHAGHPWADIGPSQFANLKGCSHDVDLKALSSRSPLQERLMQQGYRSCLAVPMQAAEQRLGVLILVATRPGAFTAEHEQITSEVARPLSIAVQQARLREELQRNAQELEQRVLIPTRELQETLETVKQRQTSTRLASARIEGLEQKARDLARFVETTRQQTLLQTDNKTEALEQKARDLANFVETLRNQTRLQSDTEIEALGQQARDLALSVEIVRKETRLKSESEIEAMGQKARDLVVSVESVRKATRLKSESDIAALGQQARDLAISMEFVREETQLRSDTEIAVLRQQARDLAASVESTREETLLRSDTEIAALGQQARDLAVSVESVREETQLHSDAEINDLKQEATKVALSVERSRLATLVASDKVIRKLNEELEQRVLERTAQLEDANKELDSFSYSVSHDLRAPLRAIAGFSRILLEDFADPLPDDGKAYLNLICDNTRQMGQLVDDLLAFSRLGRQALTKYPVDPGKTVRSCLAEMQKEQEGRQVEIVIGDMPVCKADPTLLKQVWMNLLSNALKYTRKRTEARIEIGCRPEPPPLTNGHVPPVATEAVYFVTDNGAGFDMKYAHKLFGVFQRLHRAVDYDGTGVGLAIVQRIVHRHGGRVWADAQVNRGATFSFTLE